MKNKLHIEVKMISHSEQRYPTVGDYLIDEDSGRITILVSDMGDVRKSFLIALHELVESFICLTRGIPEPTIYDFDVAFQDGNHPDSDKYDEPGDSPDAPYHHEHQFASSIERLVAHELGISFPLYDKEIAKMCE